MAASVTGTWLSRTDSGKTKFIFSFGDVDPLEELNEDWVVLERTSSRLKLQHTSGGDGSIVLSHVGENLASKAEFCCPVYLSY